MALSELRFKYSRTHISSMEFAKKDPVIGHRLKGGFNAKVSPPIGEELGEERPHSGLKHPHWKGTKAHTPKF